ncbi:MAG TPA: helix-turn-helix domain-containing protein [Naasia sp.]|jgi:hypothetical protein
MATSIDSTAASSRPAVPAQDDDDLLLTPLEVAQWLRVSKQTLMRWRVSGAGPAWLSLGGIPRYRRGDVDAYLAEVRSGGRPAS